jgi:hypothetical protein
MAAYDRPRPESASVDLLPWADPYIRQLFAEAERVEHAARSRTPLTHLADWLDEQESHEVMKTEFRQHAWRVTPTLRSERSGARSRRSESARCWAQY